MRATITLIALLPFLAFSQTTHMVAVFGGGSGNPPPSYDPQFITIDVGDIVQWDNTQGNHNVYGELDIFPNNPEGFSSGMPAQDPWTYSFTFNTPGFYEYHCTFEFPGFPPHSDTQFGNITVIDPNSVEENTPFGDLTLYPVPAGKELYLDVQQGDQLTLTIMQHDGRIVSSQPTTTLERQSIDISTLSVGHYLLNVADTKGNSVTLPFVKNVR